MASQFIQIIPPLDGNLFTGSTRMIGGSGRIITPVFDTPYGEKMRRLYIGGAGNVTIQQWDGTNITMNNLAVGIWHDVLSLMIVAAGTSATQILVAS
jgi:hypothetical protein